MSVQGLPVRQNEPYLTKAQLADLMAVSIRTIDRMMAEGMPYVTFGRRSRRFLASRAVAWASSREQRGEAA